MGCRSYSVSKAAGPPERKTQVALHYTEQAWADCGPEPRVPAVQRCQTNTSAQSCVALGKLLSPSDPSHLSGDGPNPKDASLVRREVQVRLGRSVLCHLFMDKPLPCLVGGAALLPTGCPLAPPLASGPTALPPASPQIIGTLEEVHMPQNGINHPGVTALAQAFAINPLLRVINLNDNTFTEKGAMAMAKVRGAQQGRSGPQRPELVVVFAVDPSADGCSPPGPPTWRVSRGFSHVHASRTGHLSPGGRGPRGGSACARCPVLSGLRAAAPAVGAGFRGHIEAAAVCRPRRLCPQLFTEPRLAPSALPSAGLTAESRTLPSGSPEGEGGRKEPVGQEHSGC